MSRVDPRALHALLFQHPEGLTSADVAKVLEMRVEEARALLRQEADAGMVAVRYLAPDTSGYVSRLQAPPPRGRVIFPAAKQARRDVLHRVLLDYPNGLTEADVAFQAGCDRRTARRMLEEEIQAGGAASWIVEGDRRLFRSTSAPSRVFAGRPLWVWLAIAAGAFVVSLVLYVVITAKDVPSSGARPSP